MSERSNREDNNDCERSEQSVRVRANCDEGAVVQLVRIPACHAVGREFESRPHRRG